MSIFFESIQQSPIDLELSEEEEGLVGISGEEIPQSPPIETPLIDEAVQLTRRPHRMRLWRCREWISQLGDDGFVSDDGRVMLMAAPDSSGVIVKKLCAKPQSIIVSLSGLEIATPGDDFDFAGSSGASEGHKFYVYEPDRIPDDIRELYLMGQSAIETWRSRVVRLSLETEEVECSLMDDLFPPRTFLAEYKLSLILKSLKVQCGILFVTTLNRTISIPVSILEDERDGKIANLITSLAPELSIVDVDRMYSEFVQLRRMCIDEDRRVRSETSKKSIRGESADISTIDITVSGG